MAVNGLYIVQGESNSVVALLRRAHVRGGGGWQGANADEPALLRSFVDLREVLTTVRELSDVAPAVFLAPFLDVVRSELTNGPVTAAALCSVGKLLSYGLVDPDAITAASAVESIADAVTHAKFIGSVDDDGDEAVLLRILQVLRTLLLTPIGRLLSNESICEMMQSCFRICFETRLSELLRKAAEATMADMIQLLFTRLPTFKEDVRHPYIRKLKMRATTGGVGDKSSKRRRYVHKKKQPKTPASPAVTALKPTLKSPTAVTTSETTTADVSTAPAAVDSEHKDPSTEDDVQVNFKAFSSTTGDAPTVVDLQKGLGFLSDEEIAGMTPSPSTQALSIPEEEAVTASSDVASALTSSAPPYQPPVTSVDREAEIEDSSTQAQSTAEDEVVAASSDVIPLLRDDCTTMPASDVAALTDQPSVAVSVDIQTAKESRTSDREVRFSVDSKDDDTERQSRVKDDSMSSEIEMPAAHIPYGIPCVRELLRFLIALTDPHDRQNTEAMILMGLNWLTVALEAGADHLGTYTLLMPLIRNELCRSLLALIETDKLQVFAAASRVCFLLFESLRTHLKFQLQAYFQKLMAIVSSEQARISFEQKEMALEGLVQMWRIPGLVTELYLNYDCDLYCSNLFEDLTKLLSKNAFPTVGLYSTHLLSLDALLTVVDTIDTNCIYRSSGMTLPPSALSTSAATTVSTEDGCAAAKLELPPVSGYAIGKAQNSEQQSKRSAPMSSAEALPQIRPNRQPLSLNIPSHEALIDRKKQKQILTEGTNKFNQSPAKGIAYLQEHGLLTTPLVPLEVVLWTKENPRLDKKKIADYICSRKNSAILEAFVKSFNFDAVRIDDALRMFLETFRLPGEAAEISMVMNHFADHWYKSNDEPFYNSDGAFTLAYAIIMLNTDQHNPQVRRNQPPMTVDCFKRNLSGCNGGGDFDPELLDEIYHAIKSDEIVMPAEQTGQVRENYQWKVLLRRGEGAAGDFIHAPSGWNDHDLFAIVWGPTVAALSFVFDKSDQDNILQKSLAGFRKCAAIAAHYCMSDVFDNLMISLCKFSTLMAPQHGGDCSLASAGGAPIIGGSGVAGSLDRQTSSADLRDPNQVLAISFGENSKAQMAARTVFQLVHNHGDILKEGWKNILDCVLTLFKAKLLPKTLTEAEDYVDPKGWVSIIRKSEKKNQTQKSESGLLSSLVFYLGGSGGDGREPRALTNEEQELIQAATTVIAECHPEHFVTDSKYLTDSALSELVNSVVICSSVVSAAGVNENTESSLVFYLELLISIALENKDRLAIFWITLKRHVGTLLAHSKSAFLTERVVVGLLRLANRNLFRLKEDISDEVLHSLAMLQGLRPSVVSKMAQQIACGLHELLRSNAANVHRSEHWAILFDLLGMAGAAAFGDSADFSPDYDICQSDSDYSTTQRDVAATDRGYTSDSELTVGGLGRGAAGGGSASSASLAGSRANSGEWICVDHPPSDDQTGNVSTRPMDDLAVGRSGVQQQRSGASFQRFAFDKRSIVLRPNLCRHDPKAYLKCCETLAFLVRDAAHITPENFASCVKCLRTFVEASLDGGRYALLPRVESPDADGTKGTQSTSRRGANRERKLALQRKQHGNATPAVHESAQMHVGHPSPSESPACEGATTINEPTLSDSYHQVSHQLLDLCHTLHVKASGIFESWAESDSALTMSVDASGVTLWPQCWRPLLQCIARLCCDCRRQIRTQALNYLGRAFLIHDLQALEPNQWEECFAEVLFPLLAKLLENISPMDPIGMEETRVRAMQLLSKVLLNHLSPLSSLTSFPALWLRILQFMERYLHTDRSDLLSEAIPESLKNMILVLDNTGMFQSMPDLYGMTKERLSVFLPTLLDESLPNPLTVDVPMPPPPPVTLLAAEKPTVELEAVVVHSPSDSPVSLPMPPPQPLQQPYTSVHQVILHPPAAHQTYVTPESDFGPHAGVNQNQQQ